ncbi:MAG: DNRLRE domain-containing protein, partial [Clostridia bacterium]|nr:DNRLRE domain-containing protein [Clostridia bacterium]
MDELSGSDILCENEESRNACSKTFRLVDGTNIIAIYDTPVHEQAENGVWQEIDNSLKETNDGYENKNASLKVKFFKNPTSGKLYTVQGQDFQMTWGLSKVNNTAIQVQKQSNSETDAERKLAVRSQSELVRYEDILPYVDMEYRINGNGVKENICLKDKRAATGFSFSLKTDNLQIALENNEIVLSRNGESIFTISAPYMIDAEGHRNNNLKLELSGGHNQYNVTLLPDTEWLETAAYPVIIDPVLSKYMSYSEIHSTSVTSTGYNLYETGAIVVGRESTYYGFSRGYFKFDLPEQFTSADRVIQAQLQLHTRHLDGAGPVTVNVRKVVNNFNLSTATWSTVVNCCENGPVIDSYTVSQNGVYPVAFDITTAVRSWYQDGANYGLEFISDGESSLDYRYADFYTERGGGSNSVKPSILIQYANYSGIENTLTYHTAGNGRMGVASVSDYTGNLVYTLDDVSTTGNYFPVSVSHVFDSSRRNSLNYNTGTAIFGKGFRLNLYERVMPSSVQDRPYMYIDSDGTCHYFKYKSGSGTTILYEDEFYPSRIITRYSDSSGNTTSFKLNDGSNIETFFTFNGFMNRKCDITNGKQMWVEFVSGTALVSKVHDGGGHIISFEYDGNNYLTKMTDPAGRSTTFTYTSGRLTKITRPGNRNINLSYNTNGSLSSVTDVYGAKVNIEYWTNTYNGSNSLLRVKTLTEKGLNGTDGQKLSFDYNAGQTIVTDRNSRKERLMFDHLGHTVSCEDPDGNGAFCKYSTPEQYTGLSNTTNLHLLNYDIKAQGTVRNYVPNADFEDSSLSPWVFENSTESGTGSASKNTSEKYAGNASMKVQSTSLTGRYEYQNPLTIPNVAVGKVYTISAYVKVTSITLSNSSLSGAIVYFGYHTADGWKLVRSKPKQSVTDGWVRISATMTVPSNWDSTYRIIAKAGIDQAIGTAYFDNVQVEEGSV